MGLYRIYKACIKQKAIDGVIQKRYDGCILIEEATLSNEFLAFGILF